MTKVLVAYASKHHSTAEIADAVADELRAHGLDVECLEAGETSAEGYDAVVLGSAMYAGRWLRHARTFLKHNLDALKQVPFWIFTSGPVGENVDKELEEDSKWLEPHHVLGLAESVGLRGHVVFAGKIPEDPHGFIEKAMARNTPEEFRDSRDWDQIRKWGAEIATELGAAAQPQT